ncbi:MAG TPA: chemotaxis protein CheB [Mycobacteriales bacterium]|nr:chemotaxis protein CheB [Mycobacteriales bacterium]
MSAAAPSIRILMCEDSPTYAAALRRLLEFDGDIAVVAICASAEAALEALPEAAPDLVTMDIELPGINGLEAVEEIMGVRPVPVVVISSHTQAGSDVAAAALAGGALDAVAKDDLDLLDPGGIAGAAFRRRVRILSHARVIRHPRARLRSAGRRSASVPAAAVVAVCASTGGPQALLSLLGALPADFAVPVLVVQHMAAGFAGSLAGWLDGAVAVPVGLAPDTAVPVEPGVWIAPDGAHLVLRPDFALDLDRVTPAGSHRPSGDVLFRSVAAAARSEAVAVVLTGMGSDGAAGAQAVRSAGGVVIVQDEASSVIFGMPKAAAAGGPSLVLPPERIGSYLARIRPTQRVAR